MTDKQERVNITFKSGTTVTLRDEKGLFDVLTMSYESEIARHEALRNMGLMIYFEDISMIERLK